MRIYHGIRQVLNGTSPITDEIKYTTIGISVALIHLGFTIVFGIYRITPLFLYNIAITIFYFYLGLVAVRKKQYTFIFGSSMLEILLHSTIASILLGWNWGFMLYTIALVPVTFYLTYTLPKFKDSIAFPVTASLFVAVVYFCVRLTCGRIEPLYTGTYPELMPACFYYANTTLTFVMLLAFSILFALEIRYMQRQLERENKTLGEIANYDPLTHLLNRHSMNEHLKKALGQAIENTVPFCIVLADIDDFKKVNDTFGHECGDKVLVNVAGIITGNVRECDYVCRWGGEEILILLHAEKNVAVQVAERIRKDVAASELIYKDKKVNVTITSGVSSYQSGRNIRQMVDAADKKLYKGKNQGKNQVVA